MPLGSGYSVEEQLTGKDEFGGLQIIVYPMKRKVFEKRYPKQIRRPKEFRSVVMYSMVAEESCLDMGLAPGGRMRQEIYDDPFELDGWEMGHKSRCFVHLANSLVWREITGDNPPTIPFTAKEYASHNMPWFDHYNDGTAVLKGSKKLAGAKSIKDKAIEKDDNPLPENSTVFSDPVIKIYAE